MLESSGSYGTALLIWFVSGLLALCGALCYAELGAMLPMNGGESVYLGKAYGPTLSVVFEFVSILIQKPASLAIICIVFGDYVSRAVYQNSDAVPSYLPQVLAVSCLVFLTIVNGVSVSAGIHVQDVLTVIKVLTAVVISVIGIISKEQMATTSSFEGLGSISFGQFTVAFYSG